MTTGINTLLTQTPRDHWESLSETAREQYRDQARTDKRIAVAQENFGLKLGQGSSGSIEEDAISLAWQASEASRAQAEAARQAYLARPVVCTRTGRAVPANQAVTVGDRSISFEALTAAERAFLGMEK